MTRDGVGVSDYAMKQAVTHPRLVVPQANGTYQYIGDFAVVVLIADSKVVTAWARTKVGWRIKP